MVQYTEEERKMLERYELERDARNKQELEQYTLLNAAKKEGHEEGRAEGKAEGLAQGKAEGIEKGIEKGKKENQLETIKTMFEKGASIENIAYLLDLDLEYVKEVLK